MVHEKTINRLSTSELLSDIFSDSKVFDVKSTDLPGVTIADKTLSDPVYEGDSYETVHFAPSSRRFSAQSIPSLAPLSPSMSFDLPIFGFEKEEERCRRIRENDNDFAFLGLRYKKKEYDSGFVLGELQDLWKLAQMEDDDEFSQDCSSLYDEEDCREGVVELFEDLRSNLVSRIGVLESFNRLKSMLVSKKRGVMPIYRILRRCLVSKGRKKSALKSIKEESEVRSPWKELITTNKKSVIEKLHGLESLFSPKVKGVHEVLEPIRLTLIPLRSRQEQIKCFEQMSKSKDGPINQLRIMQKDLEPSCGPEAQFEAIKCLFRESKKSPVKVIETLQAYFVSRDHKQGPVAQLNELKSSLKPLRGPVEELKRLRNMLVVKDTKCPHAQFIRLESQLSQRNGPVSQLTELESQLKTLKRKRKEEGPVGELKSLKKQLNSNNGPVSQLGELESMLKQLGPEAQLKALMTLLKHVGPESQLRELQSMLKSKAMSETIKDAGNAVEDQTDCQCQSIATGGPSKLLESLESNLVSRNGPVEQLKKLQSNLSHRKGPVEKLHEMQRYLCPMNGPVRQLKELENEVSPRIESTTQKEKPSEGNSSAGNGLMKKLEELENDLSPKTDRVTPRAGPVQELEKLQRNLSPKTDQKKELQSDRVTPRAGPVQELEKLQRNLSPRAKPVVQLSEIERDNSNVTGPVKRLGELEKTLSPKTGPVKTLEQMAKALSPKTGPVRQLEQLEQTLVPLFGPVEQLEKLKNKLVRSEGVMRQFRSLQDQLVPNVSVTEKLEDLKDLLIDVGYYKKIESRIDEIQEIVDLLMKDDASTLDDLKELKADFKSIVSELVDRNDDVYSLNSLIANSTKDPMKTVSVKLVKLRKSLKEFKREIVSEVPSPESLYKSESKTVNASLKDIPSAFRVSSHGGNKEGARVIKGGRSTTKTSTTDRKTTKIPSATRNIPESSKKKVSFADLDGSNKSTSSESTLPASTVTPPMKASSSSSRRVSNSGIPSAKTLFSKQSIPRASIKPKEESGITLSRGYIKMKCRANGTIVSIRLSQSEVERLFDSSELSTNKVDEIKETLKSKSRAAEEKLAWVDAEGDHVSIDTDGDLRVAIRCNAKRGKINALLK